MFSTPQQAKIVPELQQAVKKIQAALNAFAKNPLLIGEQAESFVKILTAKEIKDDAGNLIDMTEYKESQKNIIKKLIRLQPKQEISSSRSSSASRRGDEHL